MHATQLLVQLVDAQVDASTPPDGEESVVLLAQALVSIGTVDPSDIPVSEAWDEAAACVAQQLSTLSDAVVSEELRMAASGQLGGDEAKLLASVTVSGVVVTLRSCPATPSPDELQVKVTAERLVGSMTALTFLKFDSPDSYQV
jgi:hypothetical protein